MFFSRSSRAIASISSCSSKSDWFHVVPRAGKADASIWLGTLNGIKPDQVRVSVVEVDAEVEVADAVIDAGWRSPLSEDAMKNRALVDEDVVAIAHKETDDGACRLSAKEGEKQPYVNSVELSELKPGTKYSVHVTVQESEDLEHATTINASFKTLPDKLGGDDDPFTIFMGSCYYSLHDDCRVAKAYEKLYMNPSYPEPDVNIFMGDQVYLDIPVIDHRWVETPAQMREHMLKSYRDNWQGLHRIFKLANNMFTADDHDFYNNYPFHPLQILRLINPFKWWWNEKASIFNAWSITEQRWSAISKALFRAIQTPMGRDQYSFDVGGDLSFMKVDIRVNRKADNDQLIPEEHLTRLIDWVKSLSSPGVLVLGQPLMIHEKLVPVIQDKILSNYKAQYNQIIGTIAQSKHDIVLLSGDVHYGRIAHVKLDSGATLHEVIASPMSLIEQQRDNRFGSWQIDPDESAKSLSTVSKPKGPYTYPHDVDDVRGREVTYERFVRSKAHNPTEKDEKRTEEHFKTVSFSKQAGSEYVDMTVRAWLPRLDVEPSAAADNEIFEEDWSAYGVTNRTGDFGPYTVRLK